MVKLLRILTVLYIFLPFLVLPWMVNKTGNWYYLFGILWYFIGIILVAAHQKIILMVPICFCLWFWATHGFSLNDYVFAMFMSLVTGIVLYQISREVHNFIKRSIPETKETTAYDLKVSKMNDIVNEYRRANPEINITPEIMDRIKNEAFFADTSKINKSL